ncbi:MAG: hypothetical protein GY803_17300 [Chloroflexi bacterium]|nr:hypothetical protein [Chloroflexota bacterium]
MLQNYRLENVWESKTNELRNEIIQFWLEHGALVARQQAGERVDQVIFVVRDQSDQIVAVNTAYQQYNQQLRNHFYYYRAFVSEPHRQSDLAAQLTLTACDYFNQQFLAGRNPQLIGVFTVIESAILRKHGTQAVWRNTLIYIGQDSRGNHLRVFYFDGAHIS